MMKAKVNKFISARERMFSGAKEFDVEAAEK